MRIAIVGSRRYTNKGAVTAFVQDLPADSVVISGACEGPDQWAAEAARARDLQVIEHKPDLTGCVQRFEYTKRYHARNQVVADDCETMAAFVAPDRKGGTEDTIRRAKKAGKPVRIFS